MRGLADLAGGLAPGAAREHVRVARALGTLPELARALAQGELSYAKVLGERLDVGYAIDVLHPRAQQAPRPRLG